MKVRAIAVAAVLAAIGLAGCGGSLAGPDGAGGTGGGAAGAGGMPIDGGGGEGGAIIIVDANDNCTIGAVARPAQPVAGASCQYLLPTPPCPYVDASHINVFVGSTAILRDTAHTDGWDFTDATMTAVGIYGPSCDALENGSTASVVITYRLPIP